MNSDPHGFDPPYSALVGSEMGDWKSSSCLAHGGVGMEVPPISVPGHASGVSNVTNADAISVVEVNTVSSVAGGNLSGAAPTSPFLVRSENSVQRPPIWISNGWSCGVFVFVLDAGDGVPSGQHGAVHSFPKGLNRGPNDDKISTADDSAAAGIAVSGSAVPNTADADASVFLGFAPPSSVPFRSERGGRSQQGFLGLEASVYDEVWIVAIRQLFQMEHVY